MPRTLIGWAALGIVVILIVQNPAGAGQTVHHWVTAALTFFENL